MKIDIILKILFYTYYYTIHLFFSLFFNFIYFFVFLFKGGFEKKKEIDRLIDTTDDLFSIYNQIYKGYKFDYLFGVIDWTPNIYTMLVKKYDDCDGSSTVWKYILNRKYKKDKYFGGVNYYYIIPKSFKYINMSHVICVMNYYNRDIIFDYKNTVPTTSISIEKYYNYVYNIPEKVSVLVIKIPF